MSAFDPIITKSGEHSHYCKCDQCSGNVKRGPVRCAAFIPGGIQCSQPMYHLGSCQFDHEIPFSTHLPVEAA